MPRLLSLSLIALAVGAVAVTGYARFAPLTAPESRVAIPGTVVVDAHGAILERGASDGFRIPVTLDRIAPRMLEATISAEDRRFQSHIGVDPVAMARALTTLGSQPSGASTITQQLARRLYLAEDSRPPIVRKLDEARIAIMLEARYVKADILDLYLNDVYYGRGAYGIEAAARAYFGVSARNLDLARASYLAGLPQRPSEFDDAAGLARQAYVLGRMTADGWITSDEASAARAEPLDLARASSAAIAPEFVAYARAELARARPDLARSDGLVIETTLDAGLQTEIERLARLRLAPLADRDLSDAAVVALEPGTGRILTMLGGATDGSPRHGGAINMATSPRQPGSALKPFLYAAAFERGYTAATPLLDVPSTFATPQAIYAPVDFDRAFRGVVPLRVALASSLNVPAVRTLDAIGLEAFLEMLKRVGLHGLDEAESYGLSLTLGAGEVTLLDLTNAYASVAAGGEFVTPYAVERVRDAAGRVLYEHSAQTPTRVLSPQHAYLLADILSDPDARIPGFGGATPFDLPFPAAVKSGTSTGFRDNWTLGFTPDLAIGVWAGNADGSAMTDVSGVEGAGPIWHDAMLAAALARQMHPFARPQGIRDVTVCAPTGLLPGPACPSPVLERFVAGTEPTAIETYYQRGPAGVTLIDPPLEVRPWARDAGLSLVGDDTHTTAIRIVNPPSGTVLYVAPELATNVVMLRATLGRPARTTFELDGVAIGETTTADAEMGWALVPGRHALIVRAWIDGAEYSAASQFEVRW